MLDTLNTLDAVTTAAALTPFLDALATTDTGRSAITNYQRSGGDRGAVQPDACGCGPLSADDLASALAAIATADFLDTMSDLPDDVALAALLPFLDFITSSPQGEAVLVAYVAPDDTGDTGAAAGAGQAQGQAQGGRAQAGGGRQVPISGGEEKPQDLPQGAIEGKEAGGQKADFQRRQAQAQGQAMPSKAQQAQQQAQQARTQQVGSEE
ncbi:hypothetical protein WJX72_007917 [[Myrmecia] bisecta]|uniref:Uncharacterized protein n=1 Tax=[Myrmecia] bisecta TaxID=41462 RepID=A0AAW1PT77_9CHLO